MANTKSAKKMGRKIIRRTMINRQRRSHIRGLIRKVEEAIEEEDPVAAQTAFQNVQPHIMRGYLKGLFHKNTAARKISRLAKRLPKNDATPSPAPAPAPTENTKTL